MPDLRATVTEGLASTYEDLGAKLHKWVDPLTDEQFWKNPFAYGNDIGHLVLHLTGNLNYYIGAQIAQTGYVRHRDLEFTDAQRPAKTEVLRRFDQTVAMIAAAIRAQSADDLQKAYSAERSDAPDRFTILVDCATHADHHIGQIINLARELTRHA